MRNNFNYESSILFFYSIFSTKLLSSISNDSVNSLYKLLYYPLAKKKIIIKFKKKNNHQSNFL